MVSRCILTDENDIRRRNRVNWLEREREKKQGRKPDCELVMQKNKINVKKRILSTPWPWRWPQAWWSRFNISQFWPPWLFSEERGRKICLATPQESLWIIFQRHPRESALCWLWSQVRKRAPIGLGCQYFWNAFKTNKKSEVMNWVSKAIVNKTKTKRFYSPCRGSPWP